MTVEDQILMTQVQNGHTMLWVFCFWATQLYDPLKEFNMSSARIIVGLPLVFGLFVVGARAQGDVYPLIVRGKVNMKDGAPPPKSVGIQRICSDGHGSAPGPVT